MEKYIAVVRRGQVLRLAVDNIIYIMKVGRKVRIVSTDGQWEYYERMENWVRAMFRSPMSRARRPARP